MYALLFVFCLLLVGRQATAQEQETPINCEIQLRGLPNFAETKGLDPGTLVPYELVKTFSIRCVGEGTPIVLEAHPNVVQAAQTVEGVELRYASTGSGFLTFRETQGVTIRNSVFDNLIGGGLAPVMLVKSAMQFVNCTFEGNSLARAGALHITDSVVVIHDSKMYGNTGLSYGAIGAVDGTKLAIRGSVVEGNVGGTQMNVLGGFISGGVFAFKSTILKVEDTRFYRNLAFGAGGGGLTAVNKCIVNVTESVFEGQEGGAGAMSLFQFSEGNIFDTVFTNNKATEDAAPLTLRINSFATLTGSKFSKNTGSCGGVIANGDSELTISGGTFESNEGSTYAGAVTALLGVDVTITSTKFDSNTGQSGGALHGLSATNIVVKDSTFSHNSGQNFGGAIYQINCDKTTIDSCQFTENNAESLGGAIMQLGCSTDQALGENGLPEECIIPEYVRCSSTKILGSTFEDNVAGGIGQSVYQRGCIDVQVSSSKFLSQEKGEGLVYQQKCTTRGLEQNTYRSGGNKIKFKTAVVSQDCPSN